MEPYSYILLACGFVALAFAVHLWERRRVQGGERPARVTASGPSNKAARRPGRRAWLTRELYRGDLSALSDVASRRNFDGPGRDQVGRLRKRGFLRETSWGQCRVTLKGWLALALRLMAGRDK